jgi:hypothetical protein
MARVNFRNKNYRAMLRNKMHLRLKGEDLSANIQEYLHQHPHVAENILNTDRFVIVLTLLNHQKSIELTYDNLLFLINRIEMNNQELRAMEDDNTRKMLDDFFA